MFGFSWFFCLRDRLTFIIFFISIDKKMQVLIMFLFSKISDLCDCEKLLLQLQKACTGQLT
ncbi:MAG TPA: hypothetical protein DEF27_11560 [Oscillatoriales bacterium UBA8482]|nr:MAG: hypothetical protein AUK43_04025 [Oscillatoriales cyanobacterium CG2_30_40_61]HBW58395.1 hypothetical protein [Oscillatoriales bacterium UBA8482]